MTIDNRPDPNRSARAPLLVGIIGLWVVSVLFRVLTFNDLHHTSLVFIGIPAVLAIVMALSPTPKSSTGLILKVMTIALLMSGILLGEAFVCILFTAPLFYAVGVMVGLIADRRRKRDEGAGFSLKSRAFLLLAVTPASLEGVIPTFEFERVSTVIASRVVEGSASEIAAALARTPQFTHALPAFFELGFPAPGAAAGSGLAVGDRRTIEFTHGRHPGTLVLEIRRSEPGHVEFRPIADDTYLTHWLSWRRSEVRWIEVAPGQTLVSWTLEYRRRLDPAWYFAPLERYGVHLAAGYLIDALATPRTAGSPSRAVEGPRYIDVFCRSFGFTLR